jgi:TfoX/Sxy family transcriptional regulator of competence genes
MSYDEKVASRIRSALKGKRGIEEKKMFGGLAFLLHGNMVCGAFNDVLVLRLGEQLASETLKLPNVRPMDFTGRPMKSMVYVSAEGFDNDHSLSLWIDKALAFVRTLPLK